MDYCNAFKSLTQGMEEFEIPEKKEQKKSEEAEYDHLTQEFTRQFLIKPTKNLKNGFPSVKGFKSLIKSPYNYQSDTVETLASFDYKKPMPVQKVTIPVFHEGHNMLVGSPTGSGKTAAYLIPLLNLAAAEGISDNSEENHAVHPYCIVLTTSHELLGQIFMEAMKIGKNLFPQHGKVAILRKDHYNNKKQPRAEDGKRAKKVREKRLPVDTRILITTPIRLTTLLKKKGDKCPIKFDCLRWLVIDECDKMLESDLSEHAETNLRAFRAQLNSVLVSIRDKVSPSIALFSATLPDPVVAWAIEEISTRHCNASRGLVKIQLGDCNSAVPLVKQELRYCGTEEGKLLELRKMLIEGLVYPCLIFTESRTRAAELYREITLCDKHILVGILSGEKSESQRIATVKAFRGGKVNVLICTDLLGRGMDFRSLMMVVNYDLPPSPIEYIHRVGRTGRAGRAGGRAVTLWTDADLPHMDAILDVMSRSGVEVDPELRRLVGVWKARRAAKIHAKALGGVISQRKGERRLAAKVARAVSKSKGKSKLDKKLLRPWNPHRRSLTDVRGSKLNALKIVLEDKTSEQGNKKCIKKKKKN